MYKRTLKNRLNNFADDALDVLKDGAKYALGAYILFNLTSHNGCLDSRRTKQAEGLYDANNPVKIVANVDEEWRDNSPFVLFGAYNPRVIRRVTFEDGTQATLDYRVLAYQPFRRLVSGEEFNPQVGERYQVTGSNEFIRRM